MALVDMKRTKAERAADKKACNVPFSGEDYPYGLSIRLGRDELEKLGITTLPQVGEELELNAVAYVKSASEEQRDGGKKERRIELELRKMELESTEKVDSHEGALRGAKAAMDKALDDEDD